MLLALSTNTFAMSGDSLRHEVKCVEGYKYLFSWADGGFAGGSAMPVNVVQMYHRIADSAPPQPIKCKD